MNAGSHFSWCTEAGRAEDCGTGQTQRKTEISGKLYAYTVRHKKNLNAQQLLSQGYTVYNKSLILNYYFYFECSLRLTVHPLLRCQDVICWGFPGGAKCFRFYVGTFMAGGR